MITISIDAAMHKTGIAVFEDDTLVETKLVEVPSRITGRDASIAMAFKVCDYVGKYPSAKLIIEGQEYRHGLEKMKINDFANLYAVGVGIACLAPYNCTFYLPREWKGTVPKKIMTNRIIENEPNKELLQDNQEDIVDAIGLGRFHLGKNN